MRALTTISCLCLLFAVTAAGQEDAPADRPEEETGAPAKVLMGDVITLKTGAVLSGGQILRSTPRYYEVEFVEGVPPIRIPRRQVIDVKLDNINPLSDRRHRALYPADSGARITPGERMAPELMNKLTGPLSDLPVTFQNRDVVEILEALGKLVGAQIVVHASVRQIPILDRIWTLNKPATATLMSVLQEDLVKRFPNLKVNFELNKVIVATSDSVEDSGAG